MEVLIFLAILSVIPGAIAHSKGRSFFGWWFLGLLCFLPALITAIVIKPDYDLIERRQMRTGMKRCPYCAEVIKGEAVICRYCQRELPKAPADESKLPDSARLDVSRPTFSTAGIHFTINDKRLNTGLWISVDVGEAKADKSILEWVTLNRADPGMVLIPLGECKRLDGWRRILISANICKVIIGAKLVEGDKIIYTKFDIPIDEIRTPLLDLFAEVK